MGPEMRADIKGSGNIVVQVSRSGINVTIDARIPYLRLTQFEARTKRALDDLHQWLTSGRDISIRVLTGGAGRGKTRLALELVREAAGKGWLAGFVTPRELDRFRTYSGFRSIAIIVVKCCRSTNRSALPLPPLRGERVGVRGACGRGGVADAKRSLPLAAREGAEDQSRGQDSRPAPLTPPSPPEVGGEGVPC